MKSIFSVVRRVKTSQFHPKDVLHRPSSSKCSDGKTIALPNGCEMPTIGLGTWKSKPGEVGDAVKTAICVGYRHIDCAHVYENQQEIGKAIRQKIDGGEVTRQDLFITSKLWCTDHGDRDVVSAAIDKTLTDLCLDYLDLYLIHWPMAFKQGCELFPKDSCGNIEFNLQSNFCSVWKEMEKLVECGKTRFIGISNFNVQQIEKLMGAATIKPAVHQVECHPYLNQIALGTFSKLLFGFTAYSPLGAKDFGGGDSPLDDPAVKCMAETYSKTPAQILIRYQIQRGHSVIPKSVNADRIRQNFEVFDFELSTKDMNTLMGLERGKRGRIVTFKEAKDHPDYPFQEKEAT